MIGHALAVGVGAALGAWLRWLLALWLNGPQAVLPAGTLVANLGGGYLIGLAMGYLAAHPGLAPELRLFVMTGFLGGLTTFSTFSAEVVTMIGRQQYYWALATGALHLLGSLILTGLGILTMRMMLD
ncbi:Putative fluoride ion transporter CrcB [Burkholderiales bacterium]|nr:Putative fluoride ion transporter CrcB [Burkholderiales bacterium]